MTDRKFQIFISSTFEDLKEERRAVTESILAMGHIPVGMELFEASNDDQWTYIQNRIDDVDYYLVIIAERYGSTNSAGMSYTELEYRYAVERGVPIIAFLLDENVRASWPQARVEYEARSNIEDFRNLCRRRMVAFWTDPKDLAARCQIAIINLVRRFPRDGWIKGDAAQSPAVVAEIARLSLQNSELKETVDELRQNVSDDKNINKQKRILLTPLYQSLRAFTNNIGGHIENMIENESISKLLKKTALFDMIRVAVFSLNSGCDVFMWDITLREALKKVDGLNASDTEISNLSFVVVNFASMVNMIEYYYIQEETFGRVKPKKMMRLSLLAQQAYSSHIFDFDRPAVL